MTTPPLYREPPTYQPTLHRDQFISLVQAALIMDQTRFARQAALAWLGIYPGDLPVSLIYAQALIKSGQSGQALPVLERICQSDPEYLEAVEAMVQAQTLLHFGNPAESGTKSVSPTYANRLGWLLALGGSPNSARDAGMTHALLREKSLVSWSRTLAKARHALRDGELELAERHIHEALTAESVTPLVDATHLLIMRARLASNNSGTQMMRSLAAFYRQRWPNCQHFTLLLSDALMDGGEPDQAVALLHEIAAQDVSGQVACRLWGENHPYRNLWPEDLCINLDIPIPVSIAAVLGWNRLPEHASIMEEAATAATNGGNQKSANTAASNPEPENDPQEASRTESSPPESLRSFQEELEKLGTRLNRPNLANADGRFPVYVVMTTRQGLEKRYGSQTAGIIEVEMLRLVAAVQERRDWGALLFYPDEGTYLFNTSSKLRLERPTPRANDPWALKLSLIDLDEILKKRGERIGAVLIVGGPEVVPFHNLPNPVDDADVDVPSDNPYATSDENYFIPEWPVGRLPDGAVQQENNAQPLLYALSGLAARHKSIAHRSAMASWYRRWWGSMIGWINRKSANGSHTRPSFGITAAIWRQASLTVFRPIGEPRALHISPPANNPQAGGNGNHPSPIPLARLGYFNLHGLVDAPEWYGQRDPNNGDAPMPLAEGEDYPVAVRPADVLNSGRAPQVVFTEACYGANIINKGADEAIALKFMQVGTYAIAGSTCISYGSISPPLIAADYLGHAFWSYIRDGLPAGEALRRAKISLAREMHTRQGYLDGEDQKTLISFILYGDPLAIPIGMESSAKAVVRSARTPTHLKTVCDLVHQDQSTEPVPPEIVAYVKGVVEQYLPGMRDASLTMSLEHVNCESTRSNRQSSPPIAHNSNGQNIQLPRQPFHLARKVITLSKDVSRSAHIHHHYARLTLDAQGKLVKLVVSR